MSHISLEELFERFKQLNVLVVGDVMLDKYFWGHVERISPEAPVPIVKVQQTEARLGGAANVALNCRNLGANVHVSSVIGTDESGKQLLELLHEAQIDTKLIKQSPSRPTTTKSRIISRNQQMIRLDEEVTDELSIKEEHAFIDATLRFLQIEKPDMVIFEDYNKGVLKENVIERIITHCQHVGIMTAVDPKFKNFLAYKEVTIFKPNLKEVHDALQIDVSQPTEKLLRDVDEALRQKLNHKVSLITLSELGMYFHDEQLGGIIPSAVRNVADVSGAGDTVMAVAAMVYALTQNVNLTATISNLAGGLVCEEAGVVPISKELLLKEIQINHIIN